VLNEIAERTHQRSLIIVFSDLYESAADADLFGALNHLKHNKHEVLLFHLADKTTEIDFSFEQRPYEFIDAESNERIKLVPSQMQAQYKLAIKAFRDELTLKCHQYKIDFIEADINGGIEQVLLPYLVKRGKMR
jgi:hypothetical protein